MKKMLWIFFIMIILLFVAGCKDDDEEQTPIEEGKLLPQQNEHGTVSPKESCGNGVCDTIEQEKGICPEDCSSEILENTQTWDVPNVDLSDLDVDTPVESGVVYITMMVHLEGWNTEDTSEDEFNQHVATVDDFAKMFEEHNAKATFEVNPAFIDAVGNWHSTFLNDLYDRGHGIGVHADAGGSADRDGLTQEEFTQEIALLRQQLEQETGLDIRHVSGICSSLDWVQAAINAGYQFTSGMVGYCAMALPENERPEEYSNCPNPSACHGEMPLELTDRVHPWRVSTADNFLEDDSNGKLVVFASENILAAIGSGSTADLDQTDIDEFTDRLDEALTYSNEGKVTKVYVGWSIGSSSKINEELFEKWFDAIQPYVDSGQVKWKTIPEMYDAYVS
ncbi:MAG: hypothetical protein WC254_02510 [Candidatus Woesearchaeota archaeon]